MFKSNNLNRIVSLLNESEKQTVFSDERTPLTREDKHKFAESISSFSQMAESVSGRRNLE